MKKRLFIVTILIITATNLFSQNWLTNFDEAKKLSEDKNKNILVVFSGSDWCVPCMKLEKKIWESEEFKKFSKEHFVLLRIDFPRRKKNLLSKEQQDHNKKLAEVYNKNGYFPLVLVLDKSGKILGSTGFENISPDEYIELLKSLEESKK